MLEPELDRPAPSRIAVLDRVVARLRDGEHGIGLLLLAEPAPGEPRPESSSHAVHERRIGGDLDLHERRHADVTHEEQRDVVRGRERDDEVVEQPVGGLAQPGAPTRREAAPRRRSMPSSMLTPRRSTSPSVYASMAPFAGRVKCASRISSAAAQPSGGAFA